MQCHTKQNEHPLQWMGDLAAALVKVGVQLNVDKGCCMLELASLLQIIKMIQSLHLSSVYEPD